MSICKVKIFLKINISVSDYVTEYVLLKNLCKNVSKIDSKILDGILCSYRKYQFGLAFKKMLNPIQLRNNCEQQMLHFERTFLGISASAEIWKLATEKLHPTTAKCFVCAHSKCDPTKDRLWMVENANNCNNKTNFKW